MASKKPSGLGRGLGALLGDDVLKAESTGSLYLPISQVESCSSSLASTLTRHPWQNWPTPSESTVSSSLLPSGSWPPATIRSSPENGAGGLRGWRAFRKCPSLSWRPMTARPPSWP